MKLLVLRNSICIICMILICSCTTIAPGQTPTVTIDDVATSQAITVQAGTANAIATNLAEATYFSKQTFEAATQVAHETQQSIQATGTIRARSTFQAAPYQTMTAQVEAWKARQTAVVVTEQARQDKIINQLYDAGYIHSKSLQYYPMDDFDESWGQMNWYRWYFYGPYLSNFVLSAYTQWWSASDKANWFNSGCGIVFQAKDNGDHYLVYLGLDGIVRVERSLRGQHTLLGSGKRQSLDIPHGYARVMLIVEDGYISFFVNNNQVLTINDNYLNNLTSDPGYISFAVISGTNKEYGTRCQINNVDLWEIEGIKEVVATKTTEGCDKIIELNFNIWAYGIKTIQDNIKKFETANPCIKVLLKDFSWVEYHDTMVGLFTSGAGPEAQYGSDHWLQEWASAEWLQPLDDICPNVAGYNSELAAYAKDGMTYNGKTYGLSYYADTMDFVYNEKFLKDAGFTEAPKTLDDVYNISKAIKEKGINEYPIIMAWSQKEGAFPEAWLSMVFSQQATPPAMFDADLNPIFNQEGSSAYKVLEWVKKVYDEKLFDPASLSTAEIDQVKSLQAGAHTFSVFPQYNMAEVNKPGSGEYAGQFKIALMPGVSNATVGYVRFYSLSPKVVAAGQETVDAACKWLDYFGGKSDGAYVVVKRWAVENGLGFAQLPLFQDPDVIAAFSKWGDVPTIEAQAKLARAKEGMTTWYGAWDVYARAEIHKAILGEEPIMDALNNMANKWNVLKGQAGI